LERYPADACSIVGPTSAKEKIFPYAAAVLFLMCIPVPTQPFCSCRAQLSPRGEAYPI